jgi:hypothetical protein
VVAFFDKIKQQLFVKRLLSALGPVARTAQTKKLLFTKYSAMTVKRARVPNGG